MADLRGLMAFSKMSGSVGVSLDMLCEIAAYYLYQPWVVASLVFSCEKFNNDKVIKSYSQEEVEDYGEGFHEYVINAFLDHLADSGMIHSWKQERYTPYGLLIKETLECRRYIVCEYTDLIQHLLVGTLTHLCTPFNEITSIKPFSVKLIKN